MDLRSRVKAGYALILLAVLCVPLAVQAEVITDRKVPLLAPDDAPQPLYHKGRLAIAYYDADKEGRNLHLSWLKGGKPLTISRHGLPDAKNSYIGAFSLQGNIYLIWRPKIMSTKLGKSGDKHLLFSASYDDGKTFSRPIRLDSGNGAFHPKPLMAAGDNLYLMWLDERGDGRHYKVIFNRSTDQGRHWLKHDIQLNKGNTLTIDPFMTADGDNIWAGWLEFDKKTQTSSMKLRRSKDGGKTWSKERLLVRPKGKTIFTPEMLRTKAGLLLFYHRPDLGIILARSTDSGEHWNKPIVLPGTSKRGTWHFQLTANQRGDICAVWPGPHKLERRKTDIYLSCSHDGGLKWDNLKRLDTNTPRLTHSLSPAITMDEAGNVVVVWGDSRKIRPRLYLNYSRDGGQSWLNQDLDLNEKGKRRFVHFPNIVSDGKGKFLVTWQHQLSDAPKNETVLSYEKLTLGPSCLKLGAGKPRQLCPQKKKKISVTGPDRKKRLIERAKQFWKSYVAGDYRKGYEMLDPFYRSIIRPDAFVAQVSQFHYLDFSISEDSVNITENKAKLQVKIKFEAKRLMIKGKETAIPPTDSTIVEEWIWIDGDWFKVVYVTKKGNLLPL